MRHAFSDQHLPEHYNRPVPIRLEEQALAQRSDYGKHRQIPWKNPKECKECGIWYAEFHWKRHQDHHAKQNRTFDVTKPGMRCIEV